MNSEKAFSPPLDDALLDRLFRAEAAFLRRRCRIDDGRGGLALQRLHGARCCAGLLARYGARHPQAASPAAVVSQWSVDLLCVLLALPLAAATAGLACELYDPRLLIEDGAPVALLFSSGTVRPLDSLQDELRRRIRCGLAPLWQAVSEASGVALRLLWSNAAAAIDTGLDYFAMPRADEERAGLFGRATWEDGSDNPLWRHLRQRSGHDGPPWSVRRVCCLHPQLGGAKPRCGNCPLD